MALCSFPAMQVESESLNWLELPRDITINIFKRLSTIEIVTSVCQVCPLWWDICKDPLMWRTIQMIKLRNSPYDLVKICNYAIQRSCGQLKDIDIEFFGTDDLLKCIAENGSRLWRMRLVACYGISDKGLIQAAKQLPMLEEVDISFNGFSKDSFDAIGGFCPLLKSLTFSRIRSQDYKCDDEAIAIGKTMPKLRHLKYYGNILSDDGLLAILDGCPFLESLDLGDCLPLDLSASVVKRCYEQIKNFRLPFCFNYENRIWNLDSLSEYSNDYSDLDDEDDYNQHDLDSLIENPNDYSDLDGEDDYALHE